MVAPEVNRIDPPRTGGERDMLESWLDYYRASLLHKCSGLSPDQLAERSCPPSSMSLGGLVRHMTEMERVYAHRLAEPGLPLYYCTERSPDGDFDDVSPDTVPDDLATFVAHCVRSREVMAGLPLDREFGTAHPYTLRWVYLYLIKEYSRHLGHADLLRERVDGVIGE